MGETALPKSADCVTSVKVKWEWEIWEEWKIWEEWEVEIWEKEGWEMRYGK
jgi:hypothetical protein